MRATLGQDYPTSAIAAEFRCHGLDPIPNKGNFFIDFKGGRTGQDLGEPATEEPQKEENTNQFCPLPQRLPVWGHPQFSATSLETAGTQHLTGWGLERAINETGQSPADPI